MATTHATRFQPNGDTAGIYPYEGGYRIDLRRRGNVTSNAALYADTFLAAFQVADDLGYRLNAVEYQRTYEAGR